jgi:uncharacterized protein YjeT (DUF2065 family)
MGVLVICRGVPTLLAPAASLRWFERTTRTNGRIRVLGAFVVAFGATLVWAGASENGSIDLKAQSTLAFLLSLIGWAWVVIGTPSMVLFPSVCRVLIRAIVNAMLSSYATALSRVVGLVRVVLGVLFIYFGALAL